MAEDVRQAAEQKARSEARAQQTFARFLDDLHIRVPDQRKDTLQQVAVVVLGALEDRLRGGEPDDLHAQLPMKLKELLASHPRQENPLERFLPGPPSTSAVEFVGSVASELKVHFDQAERYTRAVFATVRDHISEGEAQDVESQLPPDLWSLWALSQ